tara:strand:- start:184 stop:381 length:198 start_codon:yes stop_codon:yes gene_type:complete
MYSLINPIVEWFIKARVLPRWKLMGILLFAIVFGYTIAVVTIKGEGWHFPFLTVLLGIVFSYDKK